MTKHAFWQALVFTLVVFIMGLLIGFFLEGYLADNIKEDLIRSEINLLDEQLRNRAIESFDIGCGLAIDSMFNFADEIYGEALKLEKIDKTDKFERGLLILHKQYDLLRMMLWQESADLRNKCWEDFHTIVYFFDYGEEVDDNFELKSLQIVYSRLLGELKDNHPSDVLLIPIAANLNLSSVDLVLQKYGIEESPAILVDENKILMGEITYSELENIVFKSNN